MKALILLLTLSCVDGLATRRLALKWLGGAAVTAGTCFVGTPNAHALADESKIPDQLDVQSFLRSGQVQNPMGVSGQAGKSRPETGIVLRDGSEVSRDARTGDVLAEILLQSLNPSEGKLPFLASYSSPWPLAKGTVFDVECRDAKTGDGVFLAVTTSAGGKAMTDLKDSFFVDQIFSPTGRFSFYGPPTDVKVQKSIIVGDDERVMDLSFSTVSQATQTEIPRRARLAARIPDGSNQAVMLIVSSSANRWNKKDTQQGVAQAIDSFRAIPAPKSSLKARGKERRSA